MIINEEEDGGLNGELWEPVDSGFAFDSIRFTVDTETTRFLKMKHL